MDTRRGSSGDREEPRPEPGVDPFSAELIELETGRNPKAGRTTRIMVAAATGAGAVLAGALLLARPVSPAFQPSPSTFAAASEGPSLVAVVPTATPSAGPSSTPGPTALPTPPPMWQWTAEGFETDLAQSPADDGAWGVGDRVLVTTYLRGNELDGLRQGFTQVTADERRVFADPPDIERLTGGTVIASRVWFLARVDGATPDQTALRLVGTADGETWKSFGNAMGLEAMSGARFVGRVAGTWVVGAWRTTGGGTGAPTPQDLLWSGDGVHWQAASVPDVPGTMELGDVAMLGTTMVALAYGVVDPEHVVTEVLRSDDGRTWRGAPVELDGGTAARDLVCGHGRCLLTVETTTDAGSSARSLWLSTDAEHWSAVLLGNAANLLAPAVDRVVVTSAGFIATIEQASPLLLSNDGSSWWSLDVLPPAQPASFTYLVAAQDLIVAVDEGGSSDVPDVIWRGSLSAMEAAPH
jgi:hypothetical protein